MAQYWLCVWLDIPTDKERLHSIKTVVRWAWSLVDTKQTRDIEALLGQCWSDVCDVGPALIKHWFNVSRSRVALQDIIRRMVRLQCSMTEIWSYLTLIGERFLSSDFGLFYLPTTP